MKKASVYILLFFYVAVQLKPLTVVVQDLLAHTFFKASHMATIHYENGRYHLHNELKVIADEDGALTKEKVPSSQKSNEDFSNQIIHKLNFSFSTEATLIPLIYNPHQDIVAGYTKINSPPPKA